MHWREGGVRGPWYPRPWYPRPWFPVPGGTGVEGPYLDALRVAPTGICAS